MVTGVSGRRKPKKKKWEKKEGKPYQRRPEKRADVGLNIFRAGTGNWQQ